MLSKSHDNLLKQIYDISLLDEPEPLNLEYIEGKTLNNKLKNIYFNLIREKDVEIPKIDGIKSLLILLDYLIDKFNNLQKISPHLLSKKNEVYFLLIEQLLKMPFDKKDKEILETLEKYFYDQDFFISFLMILNKQNNSMFIENLSFFSKVSIYIYNNKYKYFRLLKMF